MIARLVRSADFERVLRTRSRVSSAHFAVHHVADLPATPARARNAAASTELSTGVGLSVKPPVDDLPAPAPGAVWLGAVVPKRHARRAVTRTLIKRQIRSVVTHHAAALGGGLWVVRLRAPFDRGQFVSAASDALRRAARDELVGLIGQAMRRASPAA